MKSKLTLATGLVFGALMLTACSGEENKKQESNIVEVEKDPSTVNTEVETRLTGYFADIGLVDKLGLPTKGYSESEEYTSLYVRYDFTLENTGQENIGTIKNEDDVEEKYGELEYVFQASEKMVGVSNEIFGVNIFDKDGNPLGEGEYNHTKGIESATSVGGNYYEFYIGTHNAEELGLTVPTMEQLEKLESTLHEANVIIYLDGEEIGRIWN